MSESPVLQNVCFAAKIVMCGYSCEGFIGEKASIQTLYEIASTGLDSSAIKFYKCPRIPRQPGSALTQWGRINGKSNGDLGRVRDVKLRTFMDVQVNG